MDDPVCVMGWHGHQLQPVAGPVWPHHDEPLFTVLLDLHKADRIRVRVQDVGLAIPCLNAESVNRTPQTLDGPPSFVN